MTPTDERPDSDALLLSPPRQARSRRTLNRMLAAARGALRAGGEGAITVHGVADGAGVSVGAFYARFEGRDEFVAYLGERSLEEALEAWAGAVEAPDVDLHSALESLAAAHLDGPLRTVVQLHGHQDPGPPRLRRFEDRVARDLRLFDPFPSPPAPRDLLRALFLAAGMRELATRAAETPDEESAVPADPDELARVAGSMVAPASPAPDSPPTQDPDPEPAGDDTTPERASPEDQPADEGVDLFDPWG